jgi:hypothetical protein
MKLVANPDKLKPRHFVIEQDDAAGFYLYVYENDYCIRDHLQDTLEVTIDVALEDYGVPKESWKRLD